MQFCKWLCLCTGRGRSREVPLWMRSFVIENYDWLSHFVRYNFDKTLSVSRRCRLKNPPFKKVCGKPSHYDRGEIRTESADRSTPPEKKERIGLEEIKNASEKSKAPFRNINWLLEFLTNPNPVLAQEYSITNLRSKLNFIFWCCIMSSLFSNVAQST